MIEPSPVRSTTTMVESDSRINEVAAKDPQAGKNAILVRACESAISDDVRDQDRREVWNFAHRAPGRRKTGAKNLQRHGEPLNFCNHAIIVACSAMR
jgi:hypothetical protein